jgi:hypothetical protein
MGRRAVIRHQTPTIHWMETVGGVWWRSASELEMGRRAVMRHQTPTMHWMETKNKREMVKSQKTSVCPTMTGLMMIEIACHQMEVEIGNGMVIAMRPPKQEKNEKSQTLLLDRNWIGHTMDGSAASEANRSP